MHIMYDIWMFEISVVMRVTSEDEENRSMFSNAKVWIRRNRSPRRFFAKPADALAQVKPASPPQHSDSAASPISKQPVRTI